MEGESGAEQTANDLADEIQSRVGGAKLQRWAVGVLAHVGSKPVKAGGESTYWGSGIYELVQVKVPSFLVHIWPEEPKVFVRLSSTGQKSLDITWGLYGICVGPPGYKAGNPYYLRQVQSGIYTYHCYK